MNTKTNSKNNRNGPDLGLDVFPGPFSLLLVFLSFFLWTGPSRAQSGDGDACLGDSQPKSFLADDLSACRNNPFPIMTVGKFATNYQTGSGVLVAGGAKFSAHVEVGENRAEVIQAALVATPACGTSWMDQPDAQITAATRAEIDRIAPAGDYGLTLFARGDRSQEVFHFPANPWPQTPILDNYDEAQSIDSTHDFVLRLRADTTTAQTRLFVVPTASAPIPAIPDACGENSATWLIPAGKLVPGVRYLVSIMSTRSFGQRDVVGEPGLALQCGVATFVEIQAKGSSAPTTITTQPISQKRWAGESATFTVKANGAAPLRYQWYKNGAKITRAVGTSYSLSAVQSVDTGSYWVIVTGAGGSATSQIANLTVTAPVAPKITSAPQSQTKAHGEGASFSVIASGTPAPAYQWIKDGVTISGATNAIYSIAAVTISNAGGYSVRVSNLAGSVTSAVARLTVTVPVTPTITKQPASITRATGTNATFNVTATGTNPLSYQWYKNGKAIPGATSADYTISKVKPTDAGPYSVTISNPAGKITSKTATLTVTR